MAAALQRALQREREEAKRCEETDAQHVIFIFAINCDV
jgi:hypothetical protein